MKQIIFVAGVSRRTGIAKKTGNQYDIAIVNTLQPQVGADTSYMASGFNLVEMQAPPAVVMKFLGHGFPAEFEAELGIRRDGKLEIVSMTPSVQKVAPAEPRKSA